LLTGGRMTRQVARAEWRVKTVMQFYRLAIVRFAELAAKAQRWWLAGRSTLFTPRVVT